MKMKVDVAIPDLPRQLGNAATLGEPAIATSNGFRAGVNEISRQVAFVGLLDSASETASSGSASGARRSWNPFRRRA